MTTFAENKFILKMKKIMFNTASGLEQAVLNGTKTRTMRNMRVQPQKMIEFNDCFLYELTGLHFKLGVDGTILPYDDNMVSRIKGMAPFHEGEEVAIAQSYQKLGLDPDKYGAKPGWRNKMFVKSELMKHKIRIKKVKIQQPKYMALDDFINEGLTYKDKEFSFPIEKKGKDYMAASSKVPLHVFNELQQRIGNKNYYEGYFYWVFDFELIE